MTHIVAERTRTTLQLLSCVCACACVFKLPLTLLLEWLGHSSIGAISKVKWCRRCHRKETGTEEYGMQISPEREDIFAVLWGNNRIPTLSSTVCPSYTQCPPCWDR